MKSLHFLGIGLIFLVLFSCQEHAGSLILPSLRDFDQALVKIEQRDDFVGILIELVAGQRQCTFSATVLSRITTGSPDGDSVYIRAPENCIGEANITEIRVDEYSGAGIFLETISGKPYKTYYIQAILDDQGRWVFYWPEPIGVKNPIIR